MSPRWCPRASIRAWNDEDHVRLPRQYRTKFAKVVPCWTGMTGMPTGLIQWRV